MDQSVSNLLGNISKDGEEDVTLGDIVSRFEDRGFGPLLLVPSLIALLPTGAIPGVPTLCGITLFLICIQVALGKHSPWLPKKLTDKTISTNKLDSAVEKAEPFVKKTEKLLKPRIISLSQAPAKHIIAAYCAVAALCMIPLEALPFAVALPALALSITALGMTNRDGLFICFGLFLQMGTGYLVFKTLGMV
ncbi:exopolysaccharide biosynthesis protein [Alteromonas sp. D210916BOD_24]|uniref:exopolysaccharide biosynthesis protein n=1 Tax=Alteromonas sp. D210916BOD_24 TaxID=3157618 RepID=UPI00399D1551